MIRNSGYKNVYWGSADGMIEVLDSPVANWFTLGACAFVSKILRRMEKELQRGHHHPPGGGE